MPLRPAPLRRTGPAVVLLALVPMVVAPARPSAAQEGQRFEGNPLRLDLWDFRPGSDLGPSATPPGGDAGELDSSLLRSRGTPEGWDGVGWFVTRVEVPPPWQRAPLALRFTRHYGASRLYLDGEPLAEIGELGLDAQSLVPVDRRVPIVLPPLAAGWHTLAVQYANPEWERYHRVGYPAGFSLVLDTAEGAAASVAAEARRNAGRRGLFTGIFLSFALLHLLLFAFRTEGRENLDFAVMCASLAALAYLLAHKGLTENPRIVFWSEAAMNMASFFFALCGVLFVRRVFARGVPRWLPWVGLLLVPAMVWSVVRPGAAIAVVFLAMLLALVEMARCVVVAVARGVPGARIVGGGIVALALGFGAGLLANMGVLPPVPALSFTVPFASVLVLIVSMSIYLSRRYALTQRDLEHQIEQVRRLSEEKLREERRAREQMIENELLQAEVARKAEELEEARRLQLSMLPQAIPEHPAATLAAHMSTATEVGGDYYDFDIAEDGALTLAIGDATGHGMRAGTMVTATKSLFNALGADRDILATLKRSNAALKRMNLRNLNMAFLLARLEERRLLISAAGMPHPLIHRAATKTVEVLEIGGMPLGSVRSFPYTTVEVELECGDTVLFMSDGFPERANEEGEQLGYERALELFAGVAERPSQDVVEELVEAGERWAGGVEADDDVTFVVLSAR